MNTQEIKNFLSQPKKVALAVFFVFMAFFLVSVLSAGVSNRNSFPLNKVSAPMMGVPSSPYTKGGYGVAEDAYAPEFEQGIRTGTGVVISPDRKVIQSASLSIVVNKAREAVEQIKSVAKKWNGFVEYANIYETGDNRTAGSIAIRVPSKDLDEALREVKETAIKITHENVNTQDVTKQFVDLEARLRNFKAQEEQYLLILKRAEKIPDILSVTQSLSSVRENIERLQAEMNYLSAQIEMSSIAVELTAEADVKIFGVVWNPMQEIKSALNDLIESLVQFANSVISFIFFIPALALWLLVIWLGGWIIWKVARKLKTHLMTHL
ncbi:MAG: DUF4349 domain-containing protein [bacterium]|nr:DUF4349 domain-containing protein [bacterium]